MMIAEQLIQKQVKKNVRKWGIQTNLGDCEWLELVVEELGEAVQKRNDIRYEVNRKKVFDHYREYQSELVDTAAVLRQWLTLIDQRIKADRAAALELTEPDAYKFMPLMLSLCGIVALEIAREESTPVNVILAMIFTLQSEIDHTTQIIQDFGQ